MWNDFKPPFKSAMRPLVVERLGLGAKWVVDSQAVWHDAHSFQTGTLGYVTDGQELILRRKVHILFS